MNGMREMYVTAKALAYAIKTIEALPPRWQEASDAEDMKAILHKQFPMFEALVMQDADWHVDGAAGKAPVREL